MTTLTSVQASVDQLSRARVRLLVQGEGFVSAVTDDLDRLVAPSQIHAVVQDGAAAGLRGRIDLGSGVTLLGGFGVGEQDYQGVRASDDTTLALALRYAPPGMASRPFVEAGGLVGGSGQASFSRAYANGAGVAVGRGTASYANDALWGRIGWVWDFGAADQLGVYAEYGHASQSVGGYDEPLSNLDPFEAAVAGGGDHMDVGKLGARFEHDFAGGWEVFGALVVAHAFRQSQTLAVAVDGFEDIPAPAVGEQTWVEYRARLGHSVTTRSALSLYVAGVAGTAAIGDSVSLGADYRITF